jgi:hypothetical protein
VDRAEQSIEYVLKRLFDGSVNLVLEGLLQVLQAGGFLLLRAGKAVPNLLNLGPNQRAPESSEVTS